MFFYAQFLFEKYCKFNSMNLHDTLDTFQWMNLLLLVITHVTPNLLEECETWRVFDVFLKQLHQILLIEMNSLKTVRLVSFHGDDEWACQYHFIRNCLHWVSLPVKLWSVFLSFYWYIFDWPSIEEFRPNSIVCSWPWVELFGWTFLESSSFTALGTIVVWRYVLWKAVAAVFKFFLHRLYLLSEDSFMNIVKPFMFLRDLERRISRVSPHY